MSTKFFTNEDTNTLLNKLEGVFKHKNIHFFDALVGYFRASGYFQIREFVEKAAEIRILVGINIDHLGFEADRQGRFQRLQRDINKLKRAVKKSPLKPAIILEKIIEILKSYPLQTIQDGDREAITKLKRSLNPEIIIEFHKMSGLWE